MRFLRRPKLGQAAIISFLLCASATVLWIRGHRSTPTWQLRTPYGRSAFYAESGRIYFSNFRQKEYEQQVTVGALCQQMWDEYDAAKKAYEDSGRDLPAPGTEDMRQAIQDHNHKAAEINDQIGGEQLRMDEKWARNPPIVLSVPCYGVVIATGVLPVVWLTSCILTCRCSLRRNAGDCPACGYDLRATPDRCPECGLTRASSPAA